MGYTTEFEGEIRIEPPLNENEISFLRDLAYTRRMMRRNGPLYVDVAENNFGQTRRDDIIDYNSSSGERLDRWPRLRPPSPDWLDYYEEDGQPGLWLQWVPNDDGTALRWDGGEKFYNAPEWMRYIIDKLLSPAAGDYLVKHGRENERLSSFTFNHVLNGRIQARGEDPDDRWVLVVESNTVSTSAY